MRVYADNAATTAMSQVAIDAMLPYFNKVYGNPSSLHSIGQEAKEALEAARVTVAECLGCQPREIYFTSGGSEADNQAIISAARFGARKGKKHIITYIAFRGTDYSVVGWKEDFNMAFTTPVPSQIEGVKYLNTIAKLIPHNLYVGGHSKGGNIAVYAAMNCNYRVAPRIIKIFSHDGPGFREEIIKSNAFAKIKNKIHKTLPHSSLIGMLLENHEDYHVVKSNKLGGIKQHDPFSWEIINSDFNYLEKISHSSQYTSDTLHRWLSEVCDEKRKLFIDTIFDIFDSTQSENFIEISKNWKKNIPIILDSIKNMDSEVRSMVVELIKELSIFYIKNLTHNDKENISSFNENFISHLSNKTKN